MKKELEQLIRQLEKVANGDFLFKPELGENEDLNIVKKGVQMLSEHYSKLSMSYEDTDKVKNDFIKAFSKLLDIKIDIEGSESELEKALERLKEAQHLGKLGYWELDIVNNKLMWSDQIYDMFELDSNEFKATYEAFLNAIHPDDREMVNTAYSDSLVTKEQYKIRHRLKLKSGEIKYVLERCKTTFDKEGEPLKSFGTVQDVTDEVLHEKKIREVEEAKIRLEENKLLIKEVHHRVKNNFQVVISLINLQINNSKNKLVISELNAAKTRINSFALLHEKLYKGNDLKKVDLKTYICDIATSVLDSNDNEEVELNCTIDKVALNMDKASVLGLLINEIIFNSIKYAFNSGIPKPKISIISKLIGENMKLTISDNGVGIGKIKEGTLGTMLIYNLAKQIGGKANRTNSNRGVEYDIEFQLN